MSARRFIIVAVVAGVAAGLAGGCFNPFAADKPKPPSDQGALVERPSPQPSPGIPGEGDRAPALHQLDPAQLLAAKTQSWADSMGARPGSAVKRPAGPDWLDPDAFSLGGGGTPRANPPALPVRNSPSVPAGPRPADGVQRPALPIVDANKPLAISEADATPAAATEMPGDPTLRKLAQRVKEYPRDVAGHFDYQLLRFVQDQPVPDMNSIASLPAEDRELLTALLDGLSNFRTTVRADNNLLLSKKVRPILELADRVRAQADLTIPMVALCTRVDGFGRYEPIESPRLTAGQEHPVILYCEVENFSSQLNDKRMWETRLTQESVLYTETGLPIWPEKAKSTELIDATRQRRHDFFVATRLQLPANLTIGRYLLKITIIDSQVKRVAEATVPIVVVAK